VAIRVYYFGLKIKICDVNYDYHAPNSEFEHCDSPDSSRLRLQWIMDVQPQLQQQPVSKRLLPPRLPKAAHPQQAFPLVRQPTGPPIIQLSTYTHRTRIARMHTSKRKRTYTHAPNNILTLSTRKATRKPPTRQNDGRQASQSEGGKEADAAGTHLNTAICLVWRRRLR